jgi:hypothetical protein
VATLFATLVTHEQVKGIGDCGIAVYLKFCAAHRDVMDCAIDFRALERDRSGLQDLMTLVLSVVHEGDSPFAEKAFKSALLLDKFAREDSLNPTRPRK